jgi:hypothetical protein
MSPLSAVIGCSPGDLPIASLNEAEKDPSQIMARHSC